MLSVSLCKFGSLHTSTAMRFVSCHGVVPQCKVVQRKRILSKSYHFYSVLVCFLISVNLVVMPLKAYLNEEFPFVIYNSIPQITSNFTDYELYRGDVLTQMQKNYNKYTLPKHAYHFDKERGVYISRAIVRISSDGKNSIRRSFIYGLPGCVLYPLKLTDNLVEFGAGKRNISSVNHVYSIYSLDNHVINAALWITSGDDLSDKQAHENDYTIYFSIHRLRWSNQSKFYKLLYRLATCSYILYLLWSKYFTHAVWLKTYLTRDSLTFQPEAKGVTRIVIAIGDPTYLILSDPVVAIAFIVEVWSSPGVVIEAVMNVSQLSSFRYFFFGSFYLSRLLWFPYGGLRLLSFILKKMNTENSFHSCDPSVVALTTAIIVGPFTCLQANSVLSEVYHYLFSLTLSTKQEIPYIEGAIPFLTWALTIIMIPVMYGFLSSKAEAIRKKRKNKEGDQCERKERKKSQGLIFSALVENNSIKSKFFLYLIGMTNHRKKLCTGGSVDILFHLDRQYQRIPAFDHRGSDCFILCYNKENLICRLRVSCFLCLDYSKVDCITRKHTVVHNIRESELVKNNIHLRPLHRECRWIA